MITKTLAFISSLFENCTGVVLIEQDEEAFESICILDASKHLQDFTAFEPEDTIFQEFDPPEHLESSPKAWKLNLPSFKKSFSECLKTAFLVQILSATLVGFVAVGIIIFNVITLDWCFEDTPHWNKMPMSVQHLRVTADAVEGIFVQMWDFCCIILIFPLSLIKELHLLTLNLLAGFIDSAYKLFLQLYGVYRSNWMPFPLYTVFCIVIFINNYLIARHFYPHSFRNAIKIDFILSAQFLLGVPVAFFMIYELFPFYVSQDAYMRLLIAAVSPLASAIPKAACRLGAQNLKRILHPGAAHVLVEGIYCCSAIAFRFLQANLSLGLFIALGIAHAIIDLLERITITMRDDIWEYLFRLVRRQRSRQPKYRSPRSRRFIADMSIQIMMQESSALITALGFITAYQSMYSKPKPFVSNELITDFFIRAGIGLSIDLFFNTISLLIQTRVMNVAVNRVWKKKWRHHLLVNALLFLVSVLYFSGHLFDIVRGKDEYKANRYRNCSYPSFL